MRFQTRLSLAVITILAVLPNPVFGQDGRPVPGIGLGAAINEALRHSPQLMTTQDAVASAEIQSKAVQARYRPSITPMLNSGSAPDGLSQRNVGISASQLLATGAQVQVAATSLRYGSGAAPVVDSGYAIGVSQPLLRGFGASNRADLKTAERATEGTKRDAADAREELVVSVAQAYFAVVREKRLVEISGRAFDRASQLVEMSKARADVGLSTQLDVFRAELLRSQAEMSSLRDRDAYESALDDLGLLIGHSTQSPVAVEGDLAADLHALEEATGRPIDAAIAAEAPPADAVPASRLDVQNARARLTDARWNASVARWNLLPQMNLDVSYTRRGIGSPTPDLFSAFNGWRVGVSTTYSLDRSAETRSAGLAQIALGGAERAVTEAEQRAVNEVRRASRGLARANAAVALQQNAVDLAGRQRDLATFRYERGLADNLEIIDAENNVLQSEASLLGAQIDRTLAFLTLQRAAGALDPDRFLK